MTIISRNCFRVYNSALPAQQDSFNGAHDGHRLVKHIMMMGARNVVNRRLPHSDFFCVINAARIVIGTVFRQKEGCSAIYGF